jgi:hypothetical protein
MRDLIPPDTLQLGVPKSRPAVELLTVNVLRWPVEEIDGRSPRRWLYARVQEIDWFTVYELVEFMANHLDRFLTAPANAQVRNQTAFRDMVNRILERENAGCRFVADDLTEVTSPTEIQAIEKAMKAAESHGFGAVQTHIKQALQLLGKRPEPDLRNAIKEAILAVEAAAKLIQGDKKQTLDPVLDLLGQRLKLHPAFKSALSKLYGYTSDDSGIRHALLEEATVDDADARFFIVACSVFVSWLIEKADQASLLKSES